VLCIKIRANSSNYNDNIIYDSDTGAPIGIGKEYSTCISEISDSATAQLNQCEESCSMKYPFNELKDYYDDVKREAYSNCFEECQLLAPFELRYDYQTVEKEYNKLCGHLLPEMERNTEEESDENVQDNLEDIDELSMKVISLNDAFKEALREYIESSGGQLEKGDRLLDFLSKFRYTEIQDMIIELRKDTDFEDLKEEDWKYILDQNELLDHNKGKIKGFLDSLKNGELGSITFKSGPNMQSFLTTLMNDPFVVNEDDSLNLERIIELSMISNEKILLDYSKNTDWQNNIAKQVTQEYLSSDDFLILISPPKDIDEIEFVENINYLGDSVANLYENDPGFRAVTGFLPGVLTKEGREMLNDPSKSISEKLAISAGATPVVSDITDFAIVGQETFNLLTGNNVNWFNYGTSVVAAGLPFLSFAGFKKMFKGAGDEVAEVTGNVYKVTIEVYKLWEVRQAEAVKLFPDIPSERIFVDFKTGDVKVNIGIISDYTEHMISPQEFVSVEDYRLSRTLDVDPSRIVRSNDGSVFIRDLHFFPNQYDESLRQPQVSRVEYTPAELSAMHQESVQQDAQEAVRRGHYSKEILDDLNLGKTYVITPSGEYVPLKSIIE